MNTGKNVNPGVKCEVNACEHNVTGNLCDAMQINVTPKEATSEKQTDCATFKCKGC